LDAVERDDRQWCEVGRSADFRPIFEPGQDDKIGVCGGRRQWQRGKLELLVELPAVLVVTRHDHSSRTRPAHFRGDPCCDDGVPGHEAQHGSVMLRRVLAPWLVVARHSRPRGRRSEQRQPCRRGDFEGLGDVMRAVGTNHNKGS
jgi:hypothetical protein